MGCIISLPEWVNLDGRLSRLQQLPVLPQFVSVYLHPGFDQTSLRGWEPAAKDLNRVDREHRCVLLIVGVEVRAMMLAARLDNIRMTIPKKRESSSIGPTYHRRRDGLSG
jgi:hypothetical protein